MSPPEKIIERFQTGDWPDNPAYQAVHENLWREQREAFQMAADMQLSTTWDLPTTPPESPYLKKRIETFRTTFAIETNQSLRQHGNAFLFRWIRANDLLKKGPLQWDLSLRSLVGLGIIHLRENLQHSQINRLFLRAIVKEWQAALESIDPDQTGASDDSQWYKTLKKPEIERLLQEGNALSSLAS